MSRLQSSNKQMKQTNYGRHLKLIDPRINDTSS